MATFIKPAYFAVHPPGQQSAELRLHPQDLGEVQISLKVDDNQAQIQMVSPHQHVRAALEAALPVLRTQLTESGIQLGQSNISGESFSGQQQAASQQQQSQRTANHEPLAGKTTIRFRFPSLYKGA